MPVSTSAMSDAHYELRFGSLYDPGHAFAFPCNSQGQVTLDHLSPRQRQSYLRVVQLVGREFAAPMLIQSLH